MQTLFLKTRAQWRKWLARNHDRSDGVWLEFHKKASGPQTLEYEDVIEEALCYGWVDSLVKNLDARKYARKLTPRNAAGRWSASNIRRVGKLLGQGLMAEAGLKKVEAAKQAGLFTPVSSPKISRKTPREFTLALAKNRKAREYFEQLAPTQRRYFIGWIAIAKKPETRTRRVRESIRLLRQSKKLGLK
jgi:uncharacterized protein YdeI (YjbR/CyaY-like superfamily)